MLFLSGAQPIVATPKHTPFLATGLSVDRSAVSGRRRIWDLHSRRTPTPRWIQLSGGTRNTDHRLPRTINPSGFPTFFLQNFSSFNMLKNQKKVKIIWGWKNVKSAGISGLSKMISMFRLVFRNHLPPTHTRCKSRFYRDWFLTKNVMSLWCYLTSWVYWLKRIASAVDGISIYETKVDETTHLEAAG